jgi:hypothetical protein
MMFQPLESPMPLQLPYTVEQVVELLYNDLSLRDKVVMANLSESDLDSMLYVTIAKPIRKEFGIYNGNTKLLDSCCRYIGRKYKSYEDPEMVIIKELWNKAKKTHLLHLVDTTVQATMH